MAQNAQKGATERKVTWAQRHLTLAELHARQQTMCRLVGHNWQRLSPDGPKVCVRCGARLQ